MGATRSKELRRVMPPALLNAGNRNFDLGVGGDQNRRVENSVLLGTDKFFPFEEENPHVAFVFDKEIRDRPAFTDHRQREFSVRLRNLYSGRV